MEVPVVGNLICQNGITEVRRCIESVAPVVDDYFICDGGSTDGTWEFLNEWKDVYNLTLFQRPYDDQGAQRNFLLDKTPKDVWVLNLDQDEQMNSVMQRNLRGFIKDIPEGAYTDKRRELVLTISVNDINLVDDPWHFDTSNISIFATKLFYNDKNAHFTSGYHMTICYDDEVRDYTNAIEPPKTWIIKHYAYLDPKRITGSSKDGKRVYNEDEWNRDNWEIKDLPEAWK